DGASGSENRFIIDGVDTTNLRDGTSGKTMLLDFVNEVQVKSSGYAAEYGGATGGVVNILTKSGSNQFHGQAGTYYQNDSFYGDRRPTVRFSPYTASDFNTRQTAMLAPDTPWTYWSPLGDFGGPVLHDKLWFYAGIGYTKNNFNRDATFITDPSKTVRHFEWWNDQKYYNYNVSSQLSNSLRVRFSGSNQRDGSRGTAPTLEPDNGGLIPASSTGGIYPNGVDSKGMTRTGTFDKNPDGSINQAAYDARWLKQGDNNTNDTYAGTVDWVLKPTFFVNLSGGSFRTNRTTPPEFRGNAIVHTFSSANSDAAMTNLGFPTVPTQFQQVSGYSD